MKKITLIMIVTILLVMTGCSGSEKDLFLPEAKNDRIITVIDDTDEPTEKVTNEKNNNSQKRADEVNLTVIIEGEEELVPSKIHIGTGYSIYIPKEGYSYGKEYDDGLLEEKWDSTVNDDVEIEITTYTNADTLMAQSQFLKDNDDYIIEDLMGYPVYGRETDGDILCFSLYEDGENVYIVSWKYPQIAEEGFGTRLSAIAETFEVDRKTN